MFLKEMEGTLMELAEAPETRFRYVVWFDYTRQAINEIQEGTLLAAPNFASDGSTKRYSVLEVTTFLPMHYALQAGMSGYPGFVVEAARSASMDWEAQESESTEDTTKIQAVAIPTGLEIIEPTGFSDLSGTPSLGPESNIAMVGSRVKVLDSKWTNLVANNGIDQKNEKNLTVIGTMARDANVEVLLRIEELYRTHFATFGFTGVGKSNLLSTIVAKVFKDADVPVKLVFFDLMSEYSALLLDQLLDSKIRGGILTVGRYTLPEDLFKYINGISGAPDLESVTRQLAQYTLLPKALIPFGKLIRRGLAELISTKRLRFYNEAESLSVYDLFFTEQVSWGKARHGPNQEKRLKIAKDVLKTQNLGDYKKVPFTPTLAQKIREGLEASLQADPAFTEDYEPKLRTLQSLERETGISYAAATSLGGLVQDLNDRHHSSLWIVQGHNPDELRSFSKRLGEELYEQRRQQGLIDPLVSFIFDEADEFIRRDATGSYKESAEIAQTLARRGRKFGLGLGIATQRIRYLDTNIMAQPHTYFISKLPRLSDRQAVAEAFGVSEELLNQTFKFRKGDWLLMSHDATGLEAVPLPIHAPDANQRIIEWLKVRYDSK